MIFRDQRSPPPVAEDNDGHVDDNDVEEEEDDHVDDSDVEEEEKDHDDDSDVGPF